MIYYAVKIGVTTLSVMLISEAARRSSLAGAILASVPTVSVLAMIWLYTETQSVEQVASLARSIVWLVLPSLVLFIVLPVLLERDYAFYTSLAIAIGSTVVAYLGIIVLARSISFRS
jgi:hypothetical protein